MQKPVSVVSGSFDDLRARKVRFLQEVSRTGTVHVLLWSDEYVTRLTGAAPKFNQQERLYFTQAIRYVNQVTVVDTNEEVRAAGREAAAWAVLPEDDSPQKRSFCHTHRIGYQIVGEAQLAGFPITTEEAETSPVSKKVIVTGCFDWLHSGHVRFFEETSALGELYVVIGHDANVLQLKGEGHPLFPENERQYLVQAVRYVKYALVSTGHGWMDAAPEIARIKPDIYAVNEDGDRPEKRLFCDQQGIGYAVLKRLPKAGLPKRESTALRGY